MPSFFCRKPIRIIWYFRDIDLCWFLQLYERSCQPSSQRSVCGWYCWCPRSEIYLLFRAFLILFRWQSCWKCSHPCAAAQREKVYHHCAGPEQRIGPKADHQGWLNPSFGAKKIIFTSQEIKKNFCCNGSIVTDPELGTIIQLQGDQRDNVSKFLQTEGLCDKVWLNAGIWAHLFFLTAGEDQDPWILTRLRKTFRLIDISTLKLNRLPPRIILKRACTRGKSSSVRNGVAAVSVFRRFPL